jgi:hypothetical protein
VCGRSRLVVERVVLEGELIISAGGGGLCRVGQGIEMREPRRHDIRDSPLWTGEHSLWGRVVTDPVEVAAIEARVRRGGRGRRRG